MFDCYRVFVTTSSMAMISWNYLGLSIVGRTAVVLAAIVLIPFAIMGLWAIPHIHPKNWLEFNPGQVQKNFMDFLNIMFWWVLFMLVDLVSCMLVIATVYWWVILIEIATIVHNAVSYEILFYLVESRLNPGFMLMLTYPGNPN